MSEEVDITLYSHAQIKESIQNELEEWGDYIGVEFTFEQKIDLVLSVYDALNDGRVFEMNLPQTVINDTARYNTTYITN
ncbi:MAG: hypothetical protein V3S69_00240 [Dehalococcoidales bacterium]